jgi:hypothetical protein
MQQSKRIDENISEMCPVSLAGWVDPSPNTGLLPGDKESPHLLGNVDIMADPAND